MRANIVSILSVLLFSTAVMAQEDFTLEDLNFGGKNYKKYLPEDKTLVWHGDELVHVCGKECFSVDKTTGKETLLVALTDLNAALSAAENGAEASSFEGVSFPFAEKTVCCIADGGTRILYDYEKKEIVWRQNLGNISNEDFHPYSRNTAFVRDNQLCVADAEGAVVQITNDGDSRNILYGKSVHRDEFGIRKGTFWSPKGGKLAFYRMDQSMVDDYPQVNIEPSGGTIAECEPDKYPMIGGVSHKVYVGIYDVKTQQTLYLKTADPTDRYFTNIAWSPDESTVYMFELNREQNDCRLMAYDSGTGELKKCLYRETDGKYVEPLNPVVFLPWDDNKFILQSQKDGYNHLYLFDTRGNELKQLTRGEWTVMELTGFDAKNKAVIYAGNEASNMQRNIYKTDIRTGKRTLLDSGRGWHEAQLSGSGAFIADKYSEPNVPRRIDIVCTRNGKTANYLDASDPWEGHKQPVFTAGTLLAADDSTILNYRMVLPYDFNSAKRYPAIVYVYGGPHAHCVDASWHYNSRSWETYMSQKGYILFILDNRGSENRGKAFEQAVFHRLGQEEMRDQMRGVDFLKSLPYVNEGRIGVHGWSFGGFMTISLMVNFPDVFKAGVAGGPVIDWRWYEVMYGERYMGTPQSNPEGFSETSLIRRAGDLKGKLQIIIGYNDKTVVPQHSLAFIAECIRKGIQPDFFIYPGEPHNMRGYKSVHLHERISQYFDDWLKNINTTK